MGKSRANSPEKQPAKRVLVFGAFDVIHPGHLDFLTQARRLGERLVVAVARDSYIVERKGRVPIHTEAQRIQYLLATGLVDEALVGDAVPGTYSILAKIEPQVICLGYDQEEFKANLLAWLAEHHKSIEVTTLKPFKPETYKSSKLNAAAYKRK